MTRSSIAALATIAATVVGSQVATAAAQSIPPAQRPHSRVVTYDRGVVHVTLAPGASREYVRRVTLRQPPARPDAVQAALVAPSAREPYAFHTDGLLLLKGDAWRGTGAGRDYGVQLAPGTAARRLNFDVPLIARDHAYIDVKWTGTAAPAGVPTAMSRCVGTACTPTALPPALRRSGPNEFGNRFDFTRRGADALGLTVGAPGQAPLVQAALPWPA